MKIVRLPSRWDTVRNATSPGHLISARDRKKRCLCIMSFRWHPKPVNFISGVDKRADFEDLLPVMANKLGGEGLINELCNRSQLLMDKDRGVITMESLRKNAAFLGLQDLSEDELAGMVKEGDLDGDGVLN
ncbi:hypothetical protein SADUNF_Sadunf19G0111500 [Salix dunnii]|uniref:EF-hand domain-containing protein n=1 Tax=Salix dunnii TaxID=1413687 RepID=A0A835MFP2_9ROSI|nr:hypothetical protein SADUNF_Sadunf19G0111500 [Salix dunnii]